MLTCPNCRKTSLGITTASLAPGFHQTTKGMMEGHPESRTASLYGCETYYEPQRTPSQPGVYLHPNYHSGSNPLPPFNPTPQEAVLHHPGQLQNANIVERLRLLQVLNLDWPREIYCELEQLFMRQRGDRRCNRSNFTPI